MRNLRPIVALTALVVYSAPAVDAAACAEICSTKDVYGFTAGGASNCLCDNGKSTATCNCAQCYTEQSDGRVFTFSYGDNNKCQWGGADCLDCELTPSTTPSTTPTPTPTTASPTSSPASTLPPTPTPSPTPSPSPTSTPSPTPTPTPITGSPSANTTLTPAPNTTNSAGATKTPSSASGSSSSSSTESSSDGMQTWQIALIICCAALVFIVAVVALLSCYCKARRRLNESEDHDADATYYHQSHAAVVAGGGTMRMAASGRSTPPSGGTDYYDSSRLTYAKVPAVGSYSGSDSRYATALTSAENSPERISPGVGGPYASAGRPSAGSVGDASTPYGYDRRGSSMHSQAVTL